MPTESQLFTCTVCGERVDARMSAECNWCDGRYHLNQRNDVEGRDCGAVWIDEQYMALQFACNACLARDGMPATAPTPPRRVVVRPAQRPRRYRRRA